MLNTQLTRELEQLEKDYAKPIELEDGLFLDYRNDVIKPVTYYINSRYLNGDEDEFGEKPFMNVVNANSDVSKVATDFDTKDIIIESDDGDQYDISLVFNKDVYDWMKVTNYAKSLNEMNSVRADYGLVFVKKTEKIIDGEKVLKLEVPEIQNIEFDASNPLARPIIETHFMDSAEFSEKRDVWENVTEVLKAAKSEQVDQIIVKQISGKFPVLVYKACIEEEPSEDDEFTYERYCFYIAEVGSNKIYLHCEEQKEAIYKMLEWKKVAKRPGKGVIEEGIPAQIWTNDVIQKEHRWFELASKWVGQSASRGLKGRNVMSETENGTILEHEDGKPITRVDMVASAVPEFQNLIEKWGNQYERATSTYDSVRGETPPSGQAFRLQALIQQQGASTFDHRREEMGIFQVEIFNEWVLPYLAKKINKAHILSSDYSAEELRTLDENYANHNANQKVKEMVLSGEIVEQEEYEALKQGYKDFVAQTKEKRFLDIPKDYYKNFKPKVTIVTTGEQKNKMAILDTISNLLQLYMSNPQVFQTDPIAMSMMSLAMEKSGAGISPISLGMGQNKTPQVMEQVQPQAQQVTPQNEPIPA